MENQLCRKNEILYLNIHLKKLFDVIYQYSLRKHSAKVVSSSFYIKANTHAIKLIQNIFFRDELP